MGMAQTQKPNPLTAIAIRGFVADFFGASPVASALDLRSGATPRGSVSPYDSEKRTRAFCHVLDGPTDTHFGHVDKWLDRRLVLGSRGGKRTVNKEAGQKRPDFESYLSKASAQGPPKKWGWLGGLHHEYWLEQIAA